MDFISFAIVFIETAYHFDNKKCIAYSTLKTCNLDGPNCVYACCNKWYHFVPIEAYYVPKLITVPDYV